MDIELFDYVELVSDMPEHMLKRGDRGTVVEVFDGPDGFDVEFPGFVLVDVAPGDIRLVQKHTAIVHA
jgi:hypothetical protein